MKFTKKEISLCKQIAKKYRKRIKEGDYIVWAGRQCLIIEVGETYVAVKCWKSREQTAIKYTWTKHEFLTPLWTISDCLEFLGAHFYTLRIRVDDDFEVAYWSKDGNSYQCGKTPLEACLKAVLAVLEESK